jgi:hypothetical protein
MNKPTEFQIQEVEETQDPKCPQLPRDPVPFEIVEINPDYCREQCPIKETCQLYNMEISYNRFSWILYGVILAIITIAGIYVLTN